MTLDLQVDPFNIFQKLQEELACFVGGKSDEEESNAEDLDEFVPFEYGDDSEKMKMAHDSSNRSQENHDATLHDDLHGFICNGIQILVKYEIHKHETEYSLWLAQKPRHRPPSLHQPVRSVSCNLCDHSMAVIVLASSN